MIANTKLYRSSARLCKPGGKSGFKHCAKSSVDNDLIYIHNLLANRDDNSDLSGYLECAFSKISLVLPISPFNSDQSLTFSIELST